LQKLSVRELADVGARDDVRGAFAAFPVEAVAAGTIRGEGLLRGGIGVGF
jgi:hypothetical protein